MWHIIEDDDNLDGDNDPVCDLCGEPVSICECTDADFYEVFGDWEEV